ncbi:hypothetical protein SAMN04515666_1157 [Bosea lupini]|uniref:Uncharacterized protein n=1 Tax=Bosea lupini TaxID=1036779 RepID=A0A1H7ZKR6_9HYPH|nr:hypothetical protein [Bosea lupini]SEM58831.1 hypothetical protein SAMN04515666_1157 [Bosea lupini]
MSVQPVNTALASGSVDNNGSSAGFDDAIAAAQQRNTGAEGADQQDEISQDELARMVGQYGSQIMSMLLMPRMTDMLGEVMADEEG